MNKQEQLGEFNADGSVHHEPNAYYGGRPYNGGGVRVRIANTPYFYRLNPGAVITNQQRQAIEDELLSAVKPPPKAKKKPKAAPQEAIDDGS